MLNNLQLECARTELDSPQMVSSSFFPCQLQLLPMGVGYTVITKNHDIHDTAEAWQSPQIVQKHTTGSCNLQFVVSSVEYNVTVTGC